MVSAVMVWILFQKKVSENNAVSPASKENTVSPPVAAESSLPEVAIAARIRLT